MIQGFILPDDITNRKRIYWKLEQTTEAARYTEEEFESKAGNWPKKYAGLAKKGYFTCDVHEALRRIAVTVDLSQIADRMSRK